MNDYRYWYMVNEFLNLFLKFLIRSYSTGINKIESPNYLFIDLKLSSIVNPGEVEILFKRNKKVELRYKYKLLERDYESIYRKGFSAKDVIYLITLIGMQMEIQIMIQTTA